MTSPRVADAAGAAGPDIAGLHELLWQVRRDDALVRRMHHDPAGVCDEFGIPAGIARHLSPVAVPALLELGANPYLLFFAALELGVDRAEYYTQLAREADDG